MAKSSGRSKRPNNTPARARYKAQGRKLKNKLKKIKKKLKRILFLQALAAKLGKPTKIGKMILEVEKKIAKLRGR